MKPKEKSDETLTMARLEETSIALHRLSIVLAVVVFFGAMTLQGTYDPVSKAIQQTQLQEIWGE